MTNEGLDVFRRATRGGQEALGQLNVLESNACFLDGLAVRDIFEALAFFNHAGNDLQRTVWPLGHHRTNQELADQ